MFFWRSKLLSVHEREISESIRALETLRFEDGRVSMAPTEIIGQPGYLKDRVKAGAIVRARQQGITAAEISWNALDDLGLDSFAMQIARCLDHSRREGFSLDEAITKLHPLLIQCSIK